MEEERIIILDQKKHTELLELLEQNPTRIFNKSHLSDGVVVVKIDSNPSKRKKSGAQNIVEKWMKEIKELAEEG